MIMRYAIAVELGGTFVDAIEFDQHTGDVRLAKAPTTPGSPATGVIERCGGWVRLWPRRGDRAWHDARVKRRTGAEGARTGILTNEGFAICSRSGALMFRVSTCITSPTSGPSRWFGVGIGSEYLGALMRKQSRQAAR